jgi:carboxypeptidase Taq
LDDLRSGLKQRLPKILGRTKVPAPSWAGKTFPIKAQRGFNKKLLAAIGFTPEQGRLDESAHPFTDGLSPQDVRLTTRYSEQDWLMAITGTLHEGGHGLYEQGLPAEEAGNPLGEAVSLGVHESQSRLWENLVGRSLEFWQWAFPIARDFFPEQLSASSPEEVVRELQRVRPSFIRVEAVEVTYNLHVCLRFDLEVALFSGQLDVGGLAEAWNAGMDSLLGIQPSKPSEGFLQDVHWSCGLYGYFPTYSLGNLYSAQLMIAAEKALPGLRTSFTRGEFSGLREWLRSSVHAKGREFPAGVLMEKATGQKFSSDPFLAHLDARYGS